MKKTKIWFQHSDERPIGVRVPSNYDLDDVIGNYRGKINLNLKQSHASCIWLSNSSSGFPIIPAHTSVKDLMQEPNFPGNSGFNPIFVHVKSSKKPKLHVPLVKWKEPAIMPESVSAYRLSYIDREEAFDELCKQHYEMFSRSECGFGKVWMFPLLDNSHGLGKTVFAHHYITMAKKKFPNPVTEFQKLLCSATTVVIELKQSSYNAKNSSQSLLKILKEKIGDSIIDEYNELDDHECPLNYIKDVVKKAGPLFLVFDEIGNPFKSDSVEDNVDAFWKFLKKEVKQWFGIKGFFILLIGYHDFFRTVPLVEPEKNPNNSLFCIKRVPLYPLQPNAIQIVLEKTNYEENKQITVQTFYGIKDSELNAVAKRLYKLSSGIPRLICDILKECDTITKLKEFEPGMQIIDEAQYSKVINSHRWRILNLLKAVHKGCRVNLSEQVNLENLQNQIGLYQIATEAGFSWHGEITNAKLHISGAVKTYIFNSTTLMQFLQSYRATYAIFDQSKCFEWITAKRILELFSLLSSPAIIHPWFFSTPIFGKLENLVLEQKIQMLLKGTINGDRNVVLNSKTVHSDYVARAQKEDLFLKPISLVPYDKSASPDRIFLSTAIYQGSLKEVVIGVSIKKFYSDFFNTKMLKKECLIFKHIFKNMFGQQNILKFLIFCVTKFPKYMQKQFRGRGFFIYDENSEEEILKDENEFLNNSEQDHNELSQDEKDKQDFKGESEINGENIESVDDNVIIDEIIILNLSNSVERSMFFGVRKGSNESNAIESMIQGSK